MSETDEPVPEEKTSFVEGIKELTFASWVVVAGLAFVGLLMISIFVITAAGGGGADAFAATYLIFGAIFVAAAVTNLTGKGWALAFGVVLSVLILLLFGPFLPSVLVNPADSFFWLVASILPALILVVVVGVFALRGSKEGLRSNPNLATARSSIGLFTFAVIGFVIGAVVVGAIGGAAVLRILEGPSGGDINIVFDAAAPTTDQPFDPKIYNVTVGDTVVWYNTDRTAHTVTSSSGAFGSDFLITGDTFEVTFDTAGTYEYYCNPHPWMTGTIVVTP